MNDATTTDNLAIRYEDAAETVTVTGWRCKKCNHFWGDDERMARWCCATDLPCKCGARLEKHWSLCVTCIANQDTERWDKCYESAVPWDGETPLYSNTMDEFFWSGDDLCWQVEADMKEHGISEREAICRLRLQMCEPDNGTTFEMQEFLTDHLPDGGDTLDCEEIDKAVNDWIESHAPFSWHGSGPAVTVESLMGTEVSSED